MEHSVALGQPVIYAAMAMNTGTPNYSRLVVMSLAGATEATVVLVPPVTTAAMDTPGIGTYSSQLATNATSLINTTTNVSWTRW